MSADKWMAWIERAPSLVKITPAALGDALAGFPLEPKQGMEWLARALQGAMLFTGPLLPELQRPESGEHVLIRLGTETERRTKYRELSKKAGSLAAAISQHRDLIRYTIMTDEEFDALRAKLEETATLFEKVAMVTQPSGPRHRERRARANRIDCAYTVSAIFQLAFEVEPYWNDWPGSDGGPWPDFYQRLALLAFGETKTRDLRGIMKEARRRDLAERATFADGIIPEYPL